MAKNILRRALEKLGGYTQKTQRNWLLASIVIVGLLIIAALFFLPELGFSASKQAAVAITETPTEPAPMEIAPSLGREDAPITILIYADFGCPACWVWHELGVMEDLRTQYGDQIRFVWRDFPVITLRSPKAAEAGQCAHEQGKFWEFHDLVYERQGAIEASDLRTYAVEIGLEIEQFDECVASRRYRDRVNAQQHEGFQRGIRGAPTFFVNDIAIVGPQRLPVFAEIIDRLLSTQK